MLTEHWNVSVSPPGAGPVDYTSATGISTYQNVHLSVKMSTNFIMTLLINHTFHTFHSPAFYCRDNCKKTVGSYVFGQVQDEAL